MDDKKEYFTQMNSCSDGIQCLTNKGRIFYFTRDIVLHAGGCVDEDEYGEPTWKEIGSYPDFTK